MKRQDKQGVRTPAQLEQKYNFGGKDSSDKQNFAKLSRQVEQLSTTLTQFVSSTNAALTNLRADIKNLRADIDKNFKKFHPEAFTFSVTNNLTNCATNNEATEIGGTNAYYAVITGTDGAALTAYSVTMGGEDITGASCTLTEAGTVEINIASVIGDIVITAEGGTSNE